MGSFCMADLDGDRHRRDVHSGGSGDLQSAWLSSTGLAQKWTLVHEHERTIQRHLPGQRAAGFDHSQRRTTKRSNKGVQLRVEVGQKSCGDMTAIGTRW